MHFTFSQIGLLAVGLGALTPLAAQEASFNGAANPRIGLGRGAPFAVAVRAATAVPKIDGILDEAIWQQATPITDFTQRDPNEGEPATERTEASVLFTDDAIYVGVRAYDSQAHTIKGQLTRRDVSSPSDWIAVGIDSYYDRRTAFVFHVNAAGVKRDVYLFDDSNEDESWDAVWDVKVTQDDQGWVAEFRIPLSQLRFGKGQNRFGFNVYRKINRLNEEQYWRVPPKNQSGVVSRFGDLIGLDGIEPPRRLEVLPYVAGTGDLYPAEAGNPFRDGRDQNARGGADINFGITSNITMNATINPDFGQVEADPAVVNLSAFETFFPEKRPFFLEGVDIFQFSLGGGDQNFEQLFYTRRIGRSPQGRANPRGGFSDAPEQTTILGATKISGKTANGWSMGALASLTAEEHASVIDSSGQVWTDIVEPRAGYFVGTVARDFRQGQSKVSVFGTAMDRALPSNLEFLRDQAFAGGVRWSHRFANQTFSFSGWAGGSHVSGSETAIARTQRSSARYYQRPDNTHVTYDPNRTSLGGFAGSMSIGKIAGNWRFSTGVDTRSPGFEVNDMGFQQDADRTFGWIWLNRRWLKPGKVFRQFNINFNGWSGWNYGGDRVFTGANVNGWGQFKNYWNANFGGGRDFEALSTGALRGGPAFIRPGGNNFWGGFGTDPRKSLRFGMGGFFGVEDEDGGWSMHLGPNVSWRPATNLDFTVAPSIMREKNNWQYYSFSNALGGDHYVFGELNQTVTSMTLRANMTFSPNLSLQVYAQPFVAVGDYTQFKEVSDPRAPSLGQRFTTYSAGQMVDLGDGNLAVDLDQDSTPDIFLGNPDFTVLSFRSNVVLRWEYMLGSTLFLVWQHNRSDFNDNFRYDIGSHVGDIFRAPARNTFVVKFNYWLSL